MFLTHVPPEMSIASVSVKNLAPLASQVEADIAGFNSLQKIIHEYLEFNRSSPARNM